MAFGVCLTILKFSLQESLKGALFTIPHYFQWLVCLPLGNRCEVALLCYKRPEEGALNTRRKMSKII